MAIMTLLEGLFSFFSPCILPILPLYFGYLSGNAKVVNCDGTVSYRQSRIFFYTILFVLGICTSFFIMGLSFTFLGKVFEESRYIIALISGLIIIFFGLIQLGVFRFQRLNREKRFDFSFQADKMGPLTTYLLGFTFSFAWTPCVGPTLSSVLLVTANTSMMLGILYLSMYSLGFILPFLILGLFTSKVLDFLKKNQHRLHSIIRLAGVLLIVMGTFMVFQNSGSIYRNMIFAPETKLTATSLVDQFGDRHSLISYQGKVVVLSFLDRYCGACQEEMKVLTKLYDQYRENTGDVVILGVMKPGTGVNYEKIKRYLTENDYHFPTVIDQKEKMQTIYEISEYPSTVIFGKDGTKQEVILGMTEESQLEAKIENQLCGKAYC